MPENTPVVLVCGNRTENFDGTPAHVVRDTYIRPLREASGCTPLVMPAIGAEFDARRVVGAADGLLLTGWVTHVAPDLYGAERSFAETLLDTPRDRTAFALLRAALELDIPVLAICRGFQELNVACGGSLRQQAPAMHHEEPGFSVARNLERRAHSVVTEKGGLFERLGMPGEFPVNSLHAQCLDRLGANLRVEAVALDGVIEAVSMIGRDFVAGVQWHPEGDWEFSQPSALLFAAFGRALRARRETVRPPADGQRRGASEAP